MINLHLSLTNPWYKENFKNLFNRFGVISKHKTWEFEVCRNSRTLAEINFEVRFRTDHAGAMIELGLFGYEVSATFYDNRHWNDKEGRYYIYTEEGGMN
jgi:hypothetical protein